MWKHVNASLFGQNINNEQKKIPRMEWFFQFNFSLTISPPPLPFEIVLSSHKWGKHRMFLVWRGRTLVICWPMLMAFSTQPMEPIYTWLSQFPPRDTCMTDKDWFKLKRLQLFSPFKIFQKFTSSSPQFDEHFLKIHECLITKAFIVNSTVQPTTRT